MSTPRVPDHVPPELVFDFDYIQETSGREDPYEGLMALDRRGAPEFFYSPLLGGHWVARRYETVMEIFQDHRNFGTYPMVIPPIHDQPVRMIPIQSDPPDHARYRKIMGPLFTPAAARRLENILRNTAAELMDPFAKRGHVDFIAEYAHKFPPLVFLRLMGMPEDRLDEFVHWAAETLVGTPEQQSKSSGQILKFVSEFVDRKNADLTEDWTSYLISAKDTEGNPALTRDELINIAFFLFLAGLDTVLNSLSHAWRHLASRPDAQAQLAADPGAIPAAVEDLLRFNTITNNSRRVREDMVFHGLALKKGDPILLLVAVANREESQFPNGGELDLGRQHNLHLTFGAGIHRCIGSNIARAELRISMEEWLKRIPSCRIREGTTIRSVGGVTMGLESLPLVWNPAP
jgi:cytochrome P450